MKKVFLDTNVLLDFVIGRNGVEEASAILQLGEESRIELVTSFLSMANTAYVARKGRTKSELYEMLIGLSEMIKILPMDSDQLQEALNVRASDFEDALQYVCAKAFDCDVIISRNIKDFTFSTIRLYTSEDFLKSYL